MDVSPENIGFASLSELSSSVSGEELMSIKKQGVSLLVAVENEFGRWFYLHSDNMPHAEALARSWVNNHRARGCSVWPIVAIIWDRVASLGRKPVYTVYHQPCD